MTDASIVVRDVCKSYERGGELLQVLDGVDMDVPSGQFLALTGPSGSGKSTILNFLGGLALPDSGSVTIGSEELTDMDRGELADWRSTSVGFIFQSFNLIPVLTALENVELPLLLQPLSKSERRAQAQYALELVGLADRMKHRPKELSGGQEQRVAIARAIASDPALILADEPTGDLDRSSADQVLDILQRLARESKKTVVMVTHDPLAASHADRELHLDKGRFEETARP